MVEEIGSRCGAPDALPELHGRKHGDAALLRTMWHAAAVALPILRFRERAQREVLRWLWQAARGDCRGPSRLRLETACVAQLADADRPSMLSTGSARQRHDQTGSGGGDARDSTGIDSVWPAVLRQMEQRVAADQRHVAPAGTMDVSRLAVRHERLWRHLARLAGADQFGGG